MDTACHRGKNRKYAANSKHTEHTGIPQRLYLRFLCVKRAVCSWVPEFAAYFGRAVPEVRGKSRSADQNPVLCFRDLRFCFRKSGYAQRFPIFPALPELMPQTESSSYSGSIRDNIQLSWKRQKAVGGNPDNDPSLPLPDVESATTGLCSNLYTRSGNYSSAISTSRPAEALRSFAYSSPHEL